jgi:hypothetical protein
VKTEPEAKKALLALLTHWDADARIAAVKVLEKMKDDQEVVMAIARRRGSETDPRVRKIMERIG